MKKERGNEEKMAKIRVKQERERWRGEKVRKKSGETDGVGEKNGGKRGRLVKRKRRQPRKGQSEQWTNKRGD
jgi:hypothetical protein